MDPGRAACVQIAATRLECCADATGLSRHAGISIGLHTTAHPLTGPGAYRLRWIKGGPVYRHIEDLLRGRGLAGSVEDPKARDGLRSLLPFQGHTITGITVSIAGHSQCDRGNGRVTPLVPDLAGEGMFALEAGL